MFTFKTTAKRIMALAIVLAMMFSMLGDFAPLRYAALAEDTAEESSASESGSESDSHEPSDPEGGSSGSHEPSDPEGGSSGSHEFSDPEGGSSGSHEFSDSEGGSSAGLSASFTEQNGTASTDDGSVSQQDAPVQVLSSSTPADISPEASVDTDENGEARETDGSAEAQSSEGETVPAAGDGSQKVIVWPATDASEGSTEEAEPSAEQSDIQEAENNDAEQPEREQSVDTAEVTEVAGAVQGDEGRTDDDDGAQPGAEQLAPEEETSTGSDEMASDPDHAVTEDAPGKAPFDINFDAPGGVVVPVRNDEARTDEAPAGLEGAILESTAEAEASGEAETLTFAQAASAATGAQDQPTMVFLQTLIDSAMKNVKGRLAGKVQVILEKNRTYEGDITINAGNREVDDSFELALTTGDAGQDGISGGGATTINGNIRIQGVKVVMNSVMVTEKKTITVAKRGSSTTVDAYKNQGGSLTINGSRNAPNVLTINVLDKSSLTVNTSDDCDEISVDVARGAKDVKINTGGDVDVVSVNVRGGNVDINTGDGSDTLTVNVEGSANDIQKIVADTDGGRDTVNVIGNGSSKEGINISAGAADDTIDVDVRVGAGSMTVDTGDGSDIVTIHKGDHHTPETLEYPEYINDHETANVTSNAMLTIGSADRGDQVKLDASVALAINSVNITGNSGAGAAVYLKGKLGNFADPITPIRKNGVLTGFRLHTQLDSESTVASTGKNDYTLDVMLNNNRFMDALENKKKVYLDPSQDGTLIYSDARAMFTDYVVKGPVSGLKLIQVTNGTQSEKPVPLLLSNLVIDTSVTLDQDDRLDIGALVSPGLNLLLKGREIDLNGPVRANAIWARSIQGTGNMNQIMDANGKIKFDTLGYALDDITNLFSIRDDAVINVNGDVAAINDIRLETLVKHVGGIISVLPSSVNFVNVKLADARVNINSGAKLTTDIGNVMAEANISTTTGYSYIDTVDENGNTVKKLAELGMPLAVTVINNDAEVTLAEGATIKSIGDVTLRSESAVKAATYANSSTILPSPVDIAVTVISNQVNSKIMGNVESLAGRVQAYAGASVKDETVASDAAVPGAATGGFVAFNYVDQDANAIIGPNAVVTAAGSVQLFNSAVANVTTTAKAGSVKQPTEGDKDTTGQKFGKALANVALSVVGHLGKTLAGIPGFGWIDKLANSATQSLLREQYGVKLCDSMVGEKHGTARIELIPSEGNNIRAVITATPNANYRATGATVRYLVPGKDNYQYLTLAPKADAHNKFEFNLPDNDTVTVEVFVTYAQGEAQGNNDAADGNGVADVAEVLDMAGAAANNVEENEALYKLDQASYDQKTLHGLKYLADRDEAGGLRGTVVSWLAKDNKPLDKVYDGQQLLLIPIPGKNKAVANVNVSYFTEENGAQVAYLVDVAPDESGRYIFKVPEGLPETVDFVVSAAFGNEAADNTAQKSGLTGSFAVGMVYNDNQSIIEDGARVTAAGGMVELFGFKTNKSLTTADGTAVTSQSLTPSQKKKEERQVLHTEYSVSGAEFALRLTSNIPDAVKGSVTRDDKASAYHPRFTVDKDHADQVEKVILSYYLKLDTSTDSVFKGQGTRRTVELEGTKNADGSVTYTTGLTGLLIRQGTTVDVSVIFRADAVWEGATDQARSVYLIRNPIQITTNRLVDAAGNTIWETDKGGYRVKPIMGSLTSDGHVGNRYYFRVNANTEAGYTIDALDKSNNALQSSNKAVLYATWQDAGGVQQKAALKRDTSGLKAGDYYIDTDDADQQIPDGAVITVVAMFSEDLRGIRVDEAYDKKKGHGEVASISSEKAKVGDKIEVRLKADAGYVAQELKVYYYDGGKTMKKLVVSPEDLLSGVIRFDMPRTSDAEDSVVKLVPVFAKKSVRLHTITEGSDTTRVVVNEPDGMTIPHATVKLSPVQEEIEKGKKIAAVTVIYRNGGKEVAKFAYENQSEIQLMQERQETDIHGQVTKFTYDDVEFICKLGEKSVDVSGVMSVYGKATPVCPRADPGEKVMVKVTPEAGYKVKQGSVRVEITGGNGGSVHNLTLTCEGDGQYSFILPAGTKAGDGVKLSAEFEKGKDEPASSNGVSVAVGIAGNHNRNEIRGGNVYAQNGLSMLSVSVGGKVNTTARAGYNSGDVGRAGALAVQVASLENFTKIHRDVDGSISIGKGLLMINSIGKQVYTVTADATGQKDATGDQKGAGVGIAVAVDKAHSLSELAEGVRLVSNGDALPQLTMLNVSAGMKLQDVVKSMAGSIGGRSLTPVAAVDVVSVVARSTIGKLDLNPIQEQIRKKQGALTQDEQDYLNGILPVRGKIKMKAAVGAPRVEYTHTVEADGSAKGGQSATSGTFAVTYINDETRATLEQSVRAAKAVDLTASTGSGTRVTATAGAAGGLKTRAAAAGSKGSADKQADQLLGGAADMAQRFNGMDGNAIRDAADKRPQAETAENSVSAAAAFALNMQNSRSRAEIRDNVDVYTPDALSVVSTNRTEATVIADASATKSAEAVGVGIALNFPEMENIARIGTGTIEAGSITLSAGMAAVPGTLRATGVAQNSTALRNTMTASVEQYIKQKLPAQFSSGFLGGGVEAFSALCGAIADKFIRDMGLDQLVKIASGDGSIDAQFSGAGQIIVDRLKQAGMQLVAPLASTCYDIFGVYEELDQEFMKELVSDAVYGALESGIDVLVRIKDKILKNSGDAFLSAALDMVKGKLGNNGWDPSSIEELWKEVSNEAKNELLDSIINTMTLKLGDKLPMASPANVERVREFIKAMKEKSWKELGMSVWDDMLEDIRQNVWDYQKLLIKYANDDFPTILEKEALALVREGVVAASNEALEKIVAGLKVECKREVKDDRHTFVTQAISGAGASESSGAGSVAVAWLKLTTLAEMAENGGAVNVLKDGALTIRADEIRRVRTHATAAVDARTKDADNNEGAGSLEDLEVTGASGSRYHIQKGETSITMPGIVSAVFEGDELNHDTRVRLKVKPGYKPSDNTRILYKDTVNGMEVSEKLKVYSDDQGYYIKPYEKLRLKDIEKVNFADLSIGVMVNVEEALNDVPRPVARQKNQPNKALPEGAVEVSVEGRKVSNKKLQARANEIVKVRVDRTKLNDLTVSNMTYTYRDRKNQLHTENLDKIVKLSSNKDEVVYGFRMPEGRIESINVEFDIEDLEQIAKEGRDAESTDGAGRTVGKGGAFSMAFGSSTAEAVLGRRASVRAGSVSVTHNLKYEGETYATAGTDPFEGVEGDKDKGYDASVAVYTLDTDSLAKISGGMTVETTGDVKVTAAEEAATETKASAFATGSNTAIGANVAVNIATSDVLAEVGANIIAGGNVDVSANSYSEDETWSFSSALGADIQRFINKEIVDRVENYEEKINKVTTGEIFDGLGKDKSKENRTGKMLEDRLNKNKAENGKDARADLPLSTNVLRSQGAQIEGGEAANAGAAEAANRVGEVAGRNDIAAKENGNKTESLQVAAAVGVTVALHDAHVSTASDIKAGGDLNLTAQNNGNFNTRSTSGAMSFEEGPGKTIAAAVGFSVNNNEAIVNTGNALTAGNISIESTLTQNKDDLFAAKMAVQTLSGAAAGKGTDHAVAGALSTLISGAKSQSHVRPGSALRGESVKIIATDDSRLPIRAGGYNVSKGANVGMGVSVAALWSSDVTEATVGDDTTIRTSDLNLKATRAQYKGGYTFPWEWKDLITDTSDMTEEERDNIYTGLIDIHRDPGEQSYKVDINLDTYALMKLPDIMNFMSARNYYVDAIAGSVATGSAEGGNRTNSAGSGTLLRTRNTVLSSLGRNVLVTDSDYDRNKVSKVDMLADAGSNIWMLNGAADIGPSRNAAGAVITYTSNKDTADLVIGDNAKILMNTASLSSKADADVSIVDFAASVNTSTEDDARSSTGGAINILNMTSAAATRVGENAQITTNTDGKDDRNETVSINSGADLDLSLWSLSIAGAGKAAAAGGTVNYLNDSTTTDVTIGKNAVIRACGNIDISAIARERMFSLVASASGAVSSGARATAGAINVNLSAARARVNSEARTIHSNEKVNILSDAGSRATNITVGGAGSSGRAIGLSLNANIFERESTVNIARSVAAYIDGSNGVSIRADGKDYTVMGALAVAASTSANGVAGNLPVVYSGNTNGVTIGSGRIKTWRTPLNIVSHLDDRSYLIGGNIGFARSGSAVGALGMLVIRKNRSRTDLGATELDTNHNNTVNVSASVGMHGIAGGAGVAAGTRGITGNFIYVISQNTVVADASKAVIKSPNVNVNAKNDMELATFGGGLSVGSSLGAGATILVLSTNNKVRTLVKDITGWVSSVRVSAVNRETLHQINVNAGGAFSGNALELGLSIQSLDSRVDAIISGNIIATGDVDLKAVNDSNINNWTVAAAGAAKAAVTPAFVFSGYGGQTNAILASGRIEGRNVNISAQSDKKVMQNTIGVSASRTAAVSGAVSVYSLKDSTNALVRRDARIESGSLGVRARTGIDMFGTSGVLAASGSFAGAVNAMFTVVKSNTLAEMEGQAETGNSVDVTATSQRDVMNLVASISGSGKGAGALNIMSLVVGDKLEQDAADALVNGSMSEEEKKSKKKTFDADALITYLKEAGIDTAPLGTLKEDLSGDGQRAADTGLGEKKDFDAVGDLLDRDQVNTKQSNGNANALNDAKNPVKTDAKTTADVEASKQWGHTAYSSDPRDAVVARIGSDAVIKAGGVNVIATQETGAELYGAALAGSGQGSVGFGLTTARLRSNVIAAAQGSIDILNRKRLNVKAISTSQPKKADQNARELSKLLGDQYNAENRTIRVWGFIGSGSGTGAGSLSLGTVRLDNITKALLDAKVTHARGVNVYAESDYRNISATSLGAAVSGNGAVGSSVAYATSVGTVDARIGSHADISGETVVADVSTKSNFNTHTAAFMASAGIAGGAGLFNLANAYNELTQNTIVERGAKIDGGQEGFLQVKSIANSTARSWNMGISGGLYGAVGINVAEANIKPKMTTSVGVAGPNSGQTQLHLRDLIVISDARSNADAFSIAGNASLVAATGNVMLAYNDTQSHVGVANLAGSIETLNMNGKLDTRGDTGGVSVSAGGGVVGVTVAITDVTADNSVVLNADNMTVKLKNLFVTAGDFEERYRNRAYASSWTGGYGGASLNTSVALADNRGTNVARIEGTGDLNAEEVTLNAFGQNELRADMTNWSVAVVDIAPTVVLVDNVGTNSATMKLGGALNGDLKVGSVMKNNTTVDMGAYGGLGLSIKVNVAAATGKSQSEVDVDLGKASSKAITIDASNTSVNNVTTKTRNNSLSLANITGIWGGAWGEDVLNTRVHLAGTGHRFRDLKAVSDFRENVTSELTPAACGVSVGAFVDFGYYRDTASNQSHANTEIVFENASADISGDLEVGTKGRGSVSSQIKPATFSLGAANIALHKAVAVNEASQAATVRLIKGAVNVGGDVHVESSHNGSRTNGVISLTGAKTTDKNKVKVGLLVVDTNTVDATQSITSTAGIVGERVTRVIMVEKDIGYYKPEMVRRPWGYVREEVWHPVIKKVPVTVFDSDYSENTLTAKALSILANSAQTQSMAVTHSAADVGLLTVGNLDGDAINTDSHNAMLSGLRASVADDAVIRVTSDTRAEGAGEMPGSGQLIGLGFSGIAAKVGTKEKPQTSRVIIGENTALTAGKVRLAVESGGTARANIDQNLSVGVLSVNRSSQPTESWYDTGIAVGKGASLLSKDGIEMLSRNLAKAESFMYAKKVGIAFNGKFMKGSNTVHQENNIDIGDAATLNADGNGGVSMSVVTNTHSDARSDFNGGGLFDGTDADVINDVTRSARINLARNVRLSSNRAGINIETITGDNDRIYSRATAESIGAITYSRVTMNPVVRSTNEVLIGEGSILNAADRLDIRMLATSKQAGADKPGIETYAKVDNNISGDTTAYAYGGITVNLRNHLRFYGNGLNTPNGSTVNAKAFTAWLTNDGLYTKARAETWEAAVFGTATSNTTTEANLENTIWADNMNINTTEGTRWYVYSKRDKAPKLRQETNARAWSIGSASRIADTRGTLSNQIRSSNTHAVIVKGSFSHATQNPGSNGSIVVEARGKKTWRTFERCDFCNTGSGVAVQDSRRDVNKVVTRAVSVAMKPVKNLFTKDLADLKNVYRTLKNERKARKATKAQYGDGADRTASVIYATEIARILSRDARVDGDTLRNLRLWTNEETGQSVTLLPNATRLFTRAGGALGYVGETLRGDVYGEGSLRDVEVYTAVRSDAMADPEISIGSAAKLNFRSGALTLPSRSAFDLYLDEVSGNWLLGQLKAGSIVKPKLDAATTNAIALMGEIPPKAGPDSTLTDDGFEAGWRRYWLGATPETAEDADQPLVYLLVNNMTDEIDAFRTTARGFKAGEAAVDVSVYLFRDSRADRMGKIVYDMVCYDTPAGERSVFRVLTDVPEDRDIEIPKALDIVLRGTVLAGADLPVYNLGGTAMILCDGTDGAVHLMGNAYTASFDGATFESDYTIVGGIDSGDISVTVKGGQNVWPMLEDENTARDLEGNCWHRVENGWAPGPAMLQPVPADSMAA